MSIINDLNESVAGLRALQNKVEEQQYVYHYLIKSMVALHQKHRLAKNYAMSDELRNALNSVGVKIIQGTAQFGGYENTPEDKRNLMHDDTYEIDKKMLKSFLEGVRSDR